MITEDYVSFETAKLLKEKGFDEDTNCYYIEGSVEKIYYSPIRQNHNKRTTNNEFDIYIDITSGKISAPTIQMAMKWLRKKYNLHIITLPYAPMDRNAYHPDFEADMVYIAQLFKGIIPKDEIGRKVIKLTHEEACDAAIKYCLEKLI